MCAEMQNVFITVQDLVSELIMIVERLAMQEIEIPSELIHCIHAAEVGSKALYLAQKRGISLENDQNYSSRLVVSKFVTDNTYQIFSHYLLIRQAKQFDKSMSVVDYKEAVKHFDDEEFLSEELSVLGGFALNFLICRFFDRLNCLATGGEVTNHKELSTALQAMDCGLACMSRLGLVWRYNRSPIRAIRTH